MTTHHVDSQGVIQYSLADTPTDLPWFRKVLAEAEARLDAQYQAAPQSCTAWYREHRAKLVE